MYAHLKIVDGFIYREGEKHLVNQMAFIRLRIPHSNRNVNVTPIDDIFQSFRYFSHSYILLITRLIIFVLKKTRQN